MDVMQHVVHVESSFNPYAIGVVGGRLVRQPNNLPQALATARMLQSRGFNFSVGLAQVNRYNLAKYGLSLENAFDACPNLQAGARILADCLLRSGNDWGKSLSCYYSGNFVTGFRQGYVQKVFASMHAARTAETAYAGAIGLIALPHKVHSRAPDRRPTLIQRRIAVTSTANDVMQLRMTGPVIPKAGDVRAQTSGPAVAVVLHAPTPDATPASIDQAFVF
jgi:type IV secretion system protein VirB1